jgi:hypothetical protein
MRLEDFEHRFSECPYYIRHIYISDKDYILADNYEVRNDILVLQYGHSDVAFLSIDSVKKVMG